MLDAEKTIKLNIKSLGTKPLDVSPSILATFGAIYLLQTLFIPISLFFKMDEIALQFFSLISFFAAYFVYTRLIKDSKSSISLILSVVLCLLLGSSVVLLAIAAVIVVVIVVSCKKKSEEYYTPTYTPPVPQPPKPVEPTSICKNCGQALPLDSAFCHVCGTRIEKEN